IGGRAAQRLSTTGSARHRRHAVVRGKAGDQTGQESRSAGTPIDLAWALPPDRHTPHGHHHSLQHASADRSGCVAGLLPRRARLRSAQRRRLQRAALDHHGPAGPARHQHRAVSAFGQSRRHRRRKAHDRRDDGQGHLRDDAAGHEKPRRRIRKNPGQRRRNRRRADRPALRRARLRDPRPRRQPAARTGTALSFATSPHTGKQSMATQKAAQSSKSSPGFTAEERAAMKERVRELKNAKRGADGEKDVLAAIAKTPTSERKLCEQLHKVIRDAAPQLLPKTWYGMPAYANADEKVVVFFKPASKFKDRYLTLGFNDAAKL